MESMLKLNGKTVNEYKLLGGQPTIPKIMELLGLKSGQIAIKINGSHVRIKDFETYKIGPNDRIEIITLIAGG